MLPPRSRLSTALCRRLRLSMSRCNADGRNCMLKFEGCFEQPVPDSFAWPKRAEARVFEELHIPCTSLSICKIWSVYRTLPDAHQLYSYGQRQAGQAKPCSPCAFGRTHFAGCRSATRMKWLCLNTTKAATSSGRFLGWSDMLSQVSW